MLTTIITSSDQALRNRPLDSFCRTATLEQLLAEARELEQFRQSEPNLYFRVRALFFLYAIHRFHVPVQHAIGTEGIIPYEAFTLILSRRFEEAISLLLSVQEQHGPNEGISSGLADAYHQLAFQTLADQVKLSVRSTAGNKWMFRIGHPFDQPLRIHPVMLAKEEHTGYPCLHETTPVRMDLSHSGWSDIFFLGMDYPAGANVLNISVDLCIRDPKSGTVPRPPIETWFRIIEEPVIRLTSIDLGATASIGSLAEMFDFARDYLGLLKAAVIASGIVPPGMEGAGLPLAPLLEKMAGKGRGIEIVSKVNNIPKGSRLAVSTNLLASLIAVCMRATGQTEKLTGILGEEERRLVAAKAILGEWLGGSGGGWQDSGGVWPGMKLIRGMEAGAGDPEYGISKGRLLPHHTILGTDTVSAATRRRLQESLVIVHGGMAQDVGPVLEMVTEKYLLRSEKEWKARLDAIRYFDEVVQKLTAGDIRGIGAFTWQNFEGPIQEIIPWATNLYTETLIGTIKAEFGRHFWGFWMMGGMAGGGMGFIFDPARKAQGQERLQQLMLETKKRFEHAVPFAMDPVVYDFRINENGTMAGLETGDRFAGLTEGRSGTVIASGTDPGSHQKPLNDLLAELGFNPDQHEQIKAELQSGRIGLAKNRMPASTTIHDVSLAPADTLARPSAAAIACLQNREVAIVTLAGGIGTRWTQGAGVVKSLNPFAKMAGRHRNFIETHLAKTRKINHDYGTRLQHVFTTSYLTHHAVSAFLDTAEGTGGPGDIYVSPGRVIGLRLIPTERDLRFMWEEMPRQLLDEQSQKNRESLHAALIGWAKGAGEGGDYRDNSPSQCIHPVGHWYEVPNLLLNGTLLQLITDNPNLRHLLVHNIDTLGAGADPALLDQHLREGRAMTAEVITRKLDDRGGGLASVNGRVRLVEGLALPDDRIEFGLSYYSTNTFWIDIDKLLAVFGLVRADLADTRKCEEAVYRIAARMPAYVIIKEVKKRWGKGQEDIYPVTQFEKLWGDITALPELTCAYIHVSRMRGQQLKEVAQLDGWSRDGSKEYIESICRW